MATRILVVDDEPRFVRLVEANLQTEGFEVIKAASGQEALDLTVAKKPDLILLDVMMPEMDGFQALERIREFSTAPIIMLTAKGDEEHKVRGLNLGADDYVVKPFSANELIARVQAVLRRAQRKVSDFPEPTFTRGDLSINFARAEVIGLFISPAIEKELKSVLGQGFGWRAFQIREALDSPRAQDKLGGRRGRGDAA